QSRFSRQRYSVSRNGNARSRSRGPLRMLRGFHIDQIALSCALRRGNSANFDLGVAFQPRANGYSQFPCSSSHCRPQWKSYNDGSPFGLVFHRPCTHIHCSGYLRTISSITLVNLCVFSKTSRSASPVRINSNGGSKRNRYFWLRSSDRKSVV